MRMRLQQSREEDSTTQLATATVSVDKLPMFATGGQSADIEERLSKQCTSRSCRPS